MFSGVQTMIEPIITSVGSTLASLTDLFIYVGISVLGASVILLGGKALINFIQKKLSGTVR
jgi:hypothetical protein